MKNDNHTELNKIEEESDEIDNTEDAIDYG